MRPYWTRVEARIEAHYCYKWEENINKPYCKSLIMEKPFDVHTMTAKKIADIIKQPFGRGTAKNVKYGASYGAQAPKIAKTIGCSLDIGQMVFDGFWEAAKPLALLKQALTKYWETTGQRSFILGIDKRKIPTRSKHALINSLFQSAGVICAKRAMVLHDRKLRSEGLAVDFFTEDYKSKVFCQQLIAYHDESQLELSKALIGAFKTFKFEKGDEEQEKQAKELASKFKQKQEQSTGKRWSDVGHFENCYYVGYCRAGELATESVHEAGQYYNLNVDLTAGYMLGNSWATCH